jgi:hypothetical protein
MVSLFEFECFYDYLIILQQIFIHYHASLSTPAFNMKFLSAFGVSGLFIKYFTVELLNVKYLKK